MRFVAVFSALMLIAVTSPTSAFEFGTRAEAVAMVKRVLAKIKKDGLEAKKSVEIIQAIYTSAEKGKPVQLS